MMITIICRPFFLTKTKNKLTGREMTLGLLNGRFYSRFCIFMITISAAVIRPFFSSFCRDDDDGQIQLNLNL